MTQKYRVILSFLSGISDGYLQSHSFSRALINTHYQLTDEELGEFAISDLLPAVEDKSNGSKYYVLPMPLFSPTSSGKSQFVKELKKSRYITRQAFTSIHEIDQYLISGGLFHNINGIFSVNTEYPQLKLYFQQRAHNTKKREISKEDLSSTAGFFQYESYQFDVMYFELVADEKTKTHVLASCHYLGDRGIGGKSSTGFGAFSVISVEELPLGNIDAEGSALVMSSLVPTSQDLQKLNLYQVGLFQPVDRKREGIYPVGGQRYIRSGSIVSNCSSVTIGRYSQLGKDNVFPGIALLYQGEKS